MAKQKKVIDFSQYANATGKVLEKQTGHAVRPFRQDGFVNLLNNYGTAKDTSEHYVYESEDPLMDDELERFYEGNGLFSRIIDLPAEEAVKHGFDIKDLADGKRVLEPTQWTFHFQDKSVEG